eukprot:Lankesteria_metandrocarpae@DN3222_c0_g1_i1.p1
MAVSSTSANDTGATPIVVNARGAMAIGSAAADEAPSQPNIRIDVIAGAPTPTHNTGGDSTTSAASEGCAVSDAASTLKSPKKSRRRISAILKPGQAEMFGLKFEE